MYFLLADYELEDLFYSSIRVKDSEIIPTMNYIKEMYFVFLSIMYAEL